MSPQPASERQGAASEPHTDDHLDIARDSVTRSSTEEGCVHLYTEDV